MYVGMFVICAFVILHVSISVVTSYIWVCTVAYVHDRTDLLYASLCKFICVVLSILSPQQLLEPPQPLWPRPVPIAEVLLAVDLNEVEQDSSLFSPPKGDWTSQMSVSITQSHHKQQCILNQRLGQTSNRNGIKVVINTTGSSVDYCRFFCFSPFQLRLRFQRLFQYVLCTQFHKPRGRMESVRRSGLSCFCTHWAFCSGMESGISGLKSEHPFRCGLRLKSVWRYGANKL